ncbi:anti-sigma factor domain-containing protein [Halobacillus sp. B23F22_1]|uniref:anti-sigma factor domain-containing protein n=1 Tax=Halobacillus sp. B23F22_1 TaxID=3459514 RepID=UPI00373F8B87
MKDYRCDWVLDYINDQLSEEERLRFEQHLHECGECREEVQEIENMMADISSHGEQVDPPEGMKGRVFSHVFAEETPGAETVTPSKKTFATRSKVWTGALAAGLLLSIGANIILGTQLQQLSSDNENLESSLSDIQVALSELEEEQNRNELATASPFERASLSPTEGFGGGGLATMTQRETGYELLVQVQEMEELEEEQVYQVWLIEGENPVPAGAFVTDDQGNGAVTFEMNEEDQSWDAIAVTKESQPYNDQPEGDIILQAEL